MRQGAGVPLWRKNYSLLFLTEFQTLRSQSEGTGPDAGVSAHQPSKAASVVCSGPCWMLDAKMAVALGDSLPRFKHKRSGERNYDWKMKKTGWEPRGLKITDVRGRHFSSSPSSFISLALYSFYLL